MMHDGKVDVIEADINSFAFSFKWHIDFGESDKASFILKNVDGLRFAPTVQRVNTGKSRLTCADKKSARFRSSTFLP